MTTPKDKQISHALREMNDTSRGPGSVHCKRGADRTGVVVACYRIEHDNWSRLGAPGQARDHGMSWYQFPLQKYVMNYEPHSHGIRSGVENISDSIGGKAADLIDRIHK